jgi:hypothetical protein
MSPPPRAALAALQKKNRGLHASTKKKKSFFLSFLYTVGLLLLHEALVTLVLCGLAILFERVFVHPPSIMEDTACEHATEYKLVKYMYP